MPAGCVHFRSGMSGGFFRQQYDGPFGPVRSFSSAGVISQIRRADSRERHMSASGFSGRCFRSRSFFYGVRIQRVAGEMDAADAFYRQDAAFCKELLRAAKCIVPLTDVFSGDSNRILPGRMSRNSPAARDTVGCGCRDIRPHNPGTWQIHS